MTLGASACTRTPWVELRGHRYDVEIADDETERERGLMFREQMASNHGMLSIHESEQPVAYWMKTTRIALDICISIKS